MTKKIKAITIAFLITSIVFSIGIFIYYLPFIQARLAFKINPSRERTIVENTEFNLRFELQGNCNLDGEVLDHIAYSNPYFYGYFVCGDYTQYVSVQKSSEEYLDDTQIIFDEGRMRIIDFYGGEYRTVRISDSSGEKALVFSSTKSENLGRGIEILNEIKDSIELLEE